MIAEIIMEKGVHQQNYPGSGKTHLVPFCYASFRRDNGTSAYYLMTPRQWDRLKKVMVKLRRRAAWRHDIRYGYPSRDNDYNAHHYYGVKRLTPHAPDTASAAVKAGEPAPALSSAKPAGSQAAPVM